MSYCEMNNTRISNKIRDNNKPKIIKDLKVDTITNKSKIIILVSF